MGSLADMKCVPCRGEVPRLSDIEIRELQPLISDWNIETRDGVPQLERVFSFQDFSHALDFTNQVGAISEQEDHHPAILTEYKQTTVTWWTHSVKGLHRNDFIMAARTDRLYESG